ncbi:MAG: hypothetical protein D6756_09260, partial [Cyanobacteria bacterium J083]
YVHGYNQSDTGTGSNLANFRSFTGETIPTSSNAYGIEFSWAVSKNFVVGGWGAYTNVKTLASLNGLVPRGTQDIWNWAVTLAFPDLGKEGNLGGIIVGMEPWVTDSDIGIFPNEDDDNSFHVEAFYQYKINENIAVTPGLIWVTSPNSNDNNDDLLIGVIRTTFSF